MRLLDLYSGAGGAATGYHQAGFHIVGIDLVNQPRYPHQFHQGEALAYLEAHGHEFDAIHASPPCQAYSRTANVGLPEYPKMIEPLRGMLEQLDAPWVIENVPGAPLHNPIMLCGQFFGLGTYRHRLFETSGFEIREPVHRRHTRPLALMGRAPRPGEMMHVVGNYIGAAQAREAMGIDWMRRAEMAEAIPPAYTRYIGERLADEVRSRQALRAA